MKQHILVVNCGSSSLKYKIIALPDSATLLNGTVTGIAEKQGQHQLTLIQQGNAETIQQQRHFADFEAAFAHMDQDLEQFLGSVADAELTAIGHRVVHGGTTFTQPARLTDEIVDEIAALTELAPQHLPGNLQGIRLCLSRFADTPQLAVFDSAFHQSMPEHVYRYPVPQRWFTEFGIRRYGFHGSSHQYVASEAASILNKPLSQLNLISLHLGNGDSACAIRQGRSVDTSMGFTPLEGLMMGSRSGDLDASVPLYLQQKQGLSAEEVAHQLNFESGLQAICQSHDMREILSRAAQGEPDAELALDMFIYHVRKYIGAYLITLGEIDALIFTGGIGEHAEEVRARCCEGLEKFGLILDQQRNLEAETSNADISHSDSPHRILVIATDEELQIARQVAEYLESNT